MSIVLMFHNLGMSILCVTSLVIGGVKTILTSCQNILWLY